MLYKYLATGNFRCTGKHIRFRVRVRERYIVLLKSRAEIIVIGLVSGIDGRAFVAGANVIEPYKMFSYKGII